MPKIIEIVLDSFKKILEVRLVVKRSESSARIVSKKIFIKQKLNDNSTDILYKKGEKADSKSMLSERRLEN